MNNRDETSPANRYRQLARQVTVVKWVLPIVLAVVVIVDESFEHLIENTNHDYVDFAIEVTLFAIIGPSVVAGVLNWITHNLELLARANEQIEAFNVELEGKIQVRTAELEAANHELRQLDRLKSEFVSLVSHELRTPLTNIRGGLEVVMAEQNATYSAMTKETLTIVQSEANRLIRLVQRILDVSALESGQIRLNFGPVSLRPIIHRLTKDTLLFDAAHPLQLEMPLEPLLVLADEERLMDVLANLFSNAVKYSPGGSPIIVRLTRCDDFAQISVKDFGIGIPADEQAYVLNQFYRSSVNRGIQGYGLGLYFANKLVEAHGGKLWVESKGIPGEGSEFHFTLPVDKDMGNGTDPVN